MDIGSSIAVFLVLSILLLALFCFLTKYFHNKLKQTLQQTAQIYSMVDQISVASDNGDEQLKQWSKVKRKDNSSAKKKNEEDEIYVEMSDLRQPINQKMDIYKPSILKQKLDQDTQRNKVQTGRSMASLKMFAPQKLNTNRSNISNQQSTPKKSRRDAQVTKHTYLNKLVCYDSQGINIIDVEMTSIKKLRDGVIKEKKKSKIETIAVTNQQFQDQLQIYGFSIDEFKCYKFESIVEVEDMKVMQEYKIKSLSCKQMKEEIPIEDFIRYKFQMKLN